MTMPGNTSGTARLVLGELGYQVGWQQPIYIPKPAPGGEWSHTVDGRYFERLIAVTFSLVTDAVVGSRIILLQLLDSNGTIITSLPATGGVPASTTVNVSLTLEAPAYASQTTGQVVGFLPDLLIPPGWTWQLQPTDIDVNDQISNVVLLVQQFPNDAAAIPS